MVGYMRLEEQVEADFSRARRRAFLRRVSARANARPKQPPAPGRRDARIRRVHAGGALRRAVSRRSNPGLWLVHCHIAEHLEGGMMFSFEVGG
jgi:FtsP/CotA-like multicopper oxidase with cupredoxin domain